MNLSDDFISQLQNLMQQVQTLLPPTPASIDWQQTLACRWRTVGKQSYLEAIDDLSPICLNDLQGITRPGQGARQARRHRF